MEGCKVPSVGRNEQEYIHREEKPALNAVGHSRQGRRAPEIHPRTVSVGRKALCGGLRSSSIYNLSKRETT